MEALLTSRTLSLWNLSAAGARCRAPRDPNCADLRHRAAGGGDAHTRPVQRGGAGGSGRACWRGRAMRLVRPYYGGRWRDYADSRERCPAPPNTQLKLMQTVSWRRPPAAARAARTTAGRPGSLGPSTPLSPRL